MSIHGVEWAGLGLIGLVWTVLLVAAVVSYRRQRRERMSAEWVRGRVRHEDEDGRKA